MNGDRHDPSDPGSFESDGAFSPGAGLPEVDERLADWVDGRLSERDRERFDAELRVSPRLRQQLEEYEQAVASIRLALQAPTVPVALADRVMATLATQASASPRAHRTFGNLLWAIASAAALLAVAVWIDSLAGTPSKVATADAEPSAQYSAETPVGEGLVNAGVDPASGAAGAAVPGAPTSEAEELRRQAPAAKRPATSGGTAAPRGSGEVEKDKSERDKAGADDFFLGAMPRTKPAPGQAPEQQPGEQHAAKPGSEATPKATSPTPAADPEADRASEPQRRAPSVDEKSAQFRLVVPPGSSDREQQQAATKIEQLEAGEPLPEAGRSPAERPAAVEKEVDNTRPPAPAGALAGGGPAGPTTGGGGGPGQKSPAGPSTGGPGPGRGGKQDSAEAKDEAPAGRDSFERERKWIGVIKDGEAEPQDLQHRGRPAGGEEIMRLAREGESGEVLALLTIEGLLDPSQSGSTLQLERAGEVSVGRPASDAPVDRLAAELRVFFVQQLQPESVTPSLANEKTEKKTGEQADGPPEMPRSLVMGSLRFVALAGIEPTAEAGDTAKADPSKAEDQAASVTVGKPMPRDWLVEGPKADLERLLRELRGYSEATERSLRTGEVTVVRVISAPAPVPKSGDQAPGPSSPGVPVRPDPAVDAAALRRLVLRFQLRRQ